MRFYRQHRNLDIFILSIPERNFHNSAQNNHVEQYKKQSRKSSSQQQDFKDSWKAYIMSSWVTGHWIHSSVSRWLHFLTWTMQYRYLYTRNTKLLTPIIKSFVILKVLIQNKRIRWFMVWTYTARLHRVLWQLDTLHPFFYYELLIIPIIVSEISHNSSSTNFSEESIYLANIKISLII